MAARPVTCESDTAAAAMSLEVARYTAFSRLFITCSLQPEHARAMRSALVRRSLPGPLPPDTMAALWQRRPSMGA
jgi:hypothetical protein